MSEMVERVARALQAVDPANIGHKTGHALAKAALAAMREPTDKMILSIFTSETDQVRKNNWRAMIDAALEEKRK